jgi:hypothetical protein
MFQSMLSWAGISGPVVREYIMAAGRGTSWRPGSREREKETYLNVGHVSSDLPGPLPKVSSITQSSVTMWLDQAFNT